jgi:hypothetical protein
MAHHQFETATDPFTIQATFTKLPSESSTKPTLHVSETKIDTSQQRMPDIQANQNLATSAPSEIARQDLNPRLAIISTVATVISTIVAIIVARHQLRKNKN